MDRLVHRVCVATGHQQLTIFNSASPWSPNTLAFIEGEWVCCPAGERGGHDWRAAQARPYADIRDEVEQRIGSSA